MDYVRYDNQPQPPQTTSWNPSLDPQQPTPIMQPQQTPIQPTNPQTQPPPLLPASQQQAPQQQTIKSDPQPQHSQAQPIIYATSTHQPMTTYDMSVSWTPQMVPQNVIQVPQWSTATAPPPVGHAVAIGEPIVSAPVPDTCIHPAPHSQQSHYTQYSSIPTASTYWNPDLVNTQPTTTLAPLASTTVALSTPSIPEVPSDPSLIENAFSMNQPSVSSAIQAQGIAHPPQPIGPPPQQPPPAQFDDSLAMATSSQIGQLQPNISEGPGSLEDALEVIKSHAEHFSGHRQTCSSTSGDDDDDHSRGPRSGEREKERRQANNARER